MPPDERCRVGRFHKTGGRRAGLAKRGWSEGGNARIDYRFAAGQSDQYPSLVKELKVIE
jgi:hypothetical protein